MIPEIYSYLLTSYSPIGTKPLKISEIDTFLTLNDEIIKIQTNYMRKKIVKRGVII